MRSRIFLPLIAIAAVFGTLSALAEADFTMYLYRTDGAFDAFHKQQVDSITYSCIDLDGVEWDTYVTQEVWVGDSCRRVPLQKIDNLGFVQPETIVSDDVFPFKAVHDQYLVATDTLSFSMSLATPADMRPMLGNIVVAESDCLSFENGIVARVVSVDQTDEAYTYVCEAAALDDIYEQIVFYGDGLVEVTDEEEDPANSPRRISKEFNKEIWNKTFEGSIPKVPGSSYKATDRATCEIKICKTLTTPLYVEIGLTNELTSNVGVEIDVEKSWEPEPVQIGKTLKVGRITFPHPLLAFIWLEPQISLHAYFKAQGKLNINFDAHFNRKDNVKFVYSDRKWDIKHTPVMDAAVDTAKLQMQGSAELGLLPEIMFALNGSATGVGISGKVGVKQTLDLSFDALECYDLGVYEALKPTHTDTYLTYNTRLFAQAGLFDKDSKRKEYTVLDSEKLLFKNYIVPIISNTQCSRMPNGGHEVSITTERDVLLPLSLSMRLFDMDDNHCYNSVDTLRYDKNVSNYAFHFHGIDLTKTYRAYPMVHLLDWATMRANPSVEVNTSPVEIAKAECRYPYYDRNDVYYPNTMVYRVDAVLSDTEGVTEWGVDLGNGSLYAFDEVASSQSISFATGAPDGVTQGNGFRIDYSNFVYEKDLKVRAYAKRRDDYGNVATIYSDWFTTTLRYDEKPRMTYADPQIETTEMISTGYDDQGKVMYQFRTVASYTMTLTGAFWLDYIDGAVDGYGYELNNNPAWRPTYNGQWRTQWETVNWSAREDITHSNWHQLHLRNNSLIVTSDKLNWHGTNGVAEWVDITPSPFRLLAPAAKAPAWKTPATVTRVLRSVDGMAPITSECVPDDEVRR